MTSALATASSDLIMIAAPQIPFPTITHGDISSVIFGISKGNSISKLRADKEKLNSGEVKSCEGAFTVKFTTGEAQHQLYHNSTCEIRLQIDIIDETDYGLQIAGTILQTSHGNATGGLRSGVCESDNPAAKNWANELNLLHKGTRIKLIHRGAASAGAIIYIHDVKAQRIHIPHIPPEVLKPLAATSTKKSGGTVTRHDGFAALRGGRRRGIPYRY